MSPTAQLVVFFSLYFCIVGQFAITHKSEHTYARAFMHTHTHTCVLSARRITAPEFMALSSVCTHAHKQTILSLNRHLRWFLSLLLFGLSKFSWKTNQYFLILRHITTHSLKLSFVYTISSPRESYTETNDGNFPKIFIKQAAKEGNQSQFDTTCNKNTFYLQDGVLSQPVQGLDDVCFRSNIELRVVTLSINSQRRLSVPCDFVMTILAKSMKWYIIHK